MLTNEGYISACENQAVTWVEKNNESAKTLLFLKFPLETQKTFFFKQHQKTFRKTVLASFPVILRLIGFDIG